MKPKTVGRSGGQEANVPNPATETTEMSGICADSIVLTLRGERRAEDLRAGDRVITRDSGVAAVKSVTTRRVTCRAIRILAGSLGHTRPERDVILPAGQPLLVRDWRARGLFSARQAMVPAHMLIDGEFITDHGLREMSLCEITFETPHILYADGLELASDAEAVLAAGSRAA